MIRRASAVRYYRPAEAGRTQPLRIAVQTDDEQEHDVFLKPSAAPGLDLEGLANEVLAACVGSQLGIPFCEPLLVELSPEWIASVPDGAVRQMLGQSNPVAFGSVAAGDGWRSWLSTDNIGVDQRESALAIVAFDSFIENPDRRPSNSNLLVRGSGLRVIDHEMAFRIRMLLLAPKPWAVGGLNRLIQPDGHVLALALRGRNDLDFAPLHHTWSALSDEVLAECGASIPPEWAAATGAISEALTRLGAVRDKIDECLEEVRRVLQ